MSNELEVKKWTPPTIAELTEELETFAKDDILNLALSQEPPRAWIKEHPTIRVKVKTYNADGSIAIGGDGNPIMASVPMQYIPIDKQRILGKRLFGYVRVEIKNVIQLFNSVSVTVTLHFKHPITGEPLMMDGTAAIGVQTDKDAQASDMSKIKFDGVTKANGAAAAYAEKNAYDRLGRAFGGELQKDAIQFTENWTMYAKPMYDNPTIEDVQELYELKKDALTADERAHIERIITANETKSFNKVINQLKNK